MLIISAVMKAFAYKLETDPSINIVHTVHLVKRFVAKNMYFVVATQHSVRANIW